MDLVLATEDSKIELERELERFGNRSEVQPGLFETELGSAAGSRLPQLVFARQLLPHAQPLTAESIRAWAETLADAVIGVLSDTDPWALHVFPFQPVLDSERSGARAWHTTRAHARAPESSPSPRRRARAQPKAPDSIAVA